MGHDKTAKARMAKKKENTVTVVLRKRPRLNFRPAALISAIFEAENAEGFTVNIIFTDNPDIKRINLEYRSKNRPTDVISLVSGKSGDIFISVEKAAEQAADYSSTFDREVKRLVIHGALHVLGYDHIVEKDRKEMAPKEKKYLKMSGEK